VPLPDLLEEVWSGSWARPAPQIGTIDGTDEGLLVKGRVNGLHEPPSSGKTMVALYIAAQEIALGHTVWYLDLEDHPHTALSRLKDLGAPRKTVEQYFRYVRPDTPLLDMSGTSRAGALPDFKRDRFVRFLDDDRDLDPLWWSRGFGCHGLNVAANSAGVRCPSPAW
jgi:hypothetical protein